MIVIDRRKYALTVVVDGGVASGEGVLVGGGVDRRRGVVGRREGGIGMRGTVGVHLA